MEIMYRYNSRSNVIYLTSFDVIKETTKGRWLNVYGANKFVLNEGRKRFAWETKELALKSFIARKEMQQNILIEQLANVATVLGRAKVSTPDTIDHYEDVIFD